MKHPTIHRLGPWRLPTCEECGPFTLPTTSGTKAVLAARRHLGQHLLAKLNNPPAPQEP